jgi:pimeloyl-ACP methyl ester carboxylesterase
MVDIAVAGGSASDGVVMEQGRLRTVAVQGFSEALRTADGWIGDGLAFTRPWGFDPAAIKAPTWLWHGSRDVYSPPGHSRWLASHIPGAALSVDRYQGHFAAFTRQVGAIRWAASLTDTPDPDSGPVPPVKPASDVLPVGPLDPASRALSAEPTR